MLSYPRPSRVALFEAIAVVVPAIVCDSTSGTRPARRLFIPLQLLLRRSPPRVAPKGSSRDEKASWAAKDALTISLRALGRRYRRLGTPIFLTRGTRPTQRGAVPRRERQAERERERNQRSTIKAARLVCLAKAFLRPAIDPAARIGAPYPRDCSSSFCRRFYYEEAFLPRRFAVRSDRVKDCIAKIALSRSDE